MTSIANKSLVKLDSVNKIFELGDGIHALRNINISIERGERVAIMGQSGSGKSTLLNLICGLDTPTSGTIYFEERDLATMGDDERTRLRRQKIGMIFQTFNLLPTLNVAENVALPLMLNGGSSRAAAKRAGELLERVGLGSRSGHRPDELSGGERQRVAIARALVFDPPLLLADEPTGNLDSRTGDEILEMLYRLRDEHGMTLVLVTHNENAGSTCERKVTLLDGRIVEDVTTAVAS